MAHWIAAYERDGFPVEKTAFGNYEVAILLLGPTWHWLVRRAFVDLAEGSVHDAVAAREGAAACIRMLDEPRRAEIAGQ